MTVLALSLVAAACGGGDEDDASTTTQAEATSAASTSASAATTAATAAATEDGVTYASPEGDYTVVFPEEPTEQVQSQPLPDGLSIELTIVGVDLDDSFNATSRGDYPEGYQIVDVAAALQGAQDQALENVGGTLEDSRDIELQGRPGRQFSAAVESGGVEGTLLSRVYLSETTIYQVLRTGAGDLSFTDEDAAAFFDSFRFTAG